MNLIKNGSFESGQLPPWTLDLGDEDKIEFSEHHALLLPASFQITQSIDVALVNGLHSVVFKVNARASMVAAAEALKVKCRFRFGVRCLYPDEVAGNIVLFDASSGMLSFEGQARLIPDKPLNHMDVICSVDGVVPGPDFDLRDIWFTGFELMAGPSIP
ncbi:hypothetical protein ACIP1T_20900 [Pseudomonas japonica]|uniref:hypothetical protein n=1 Tax=Pseudomonas japonica TaxID=256466 RepID=UPI0038288E34